VLRGVVTDENGNVVEGAQVRVEGVGKHVTTTNRYMIKSEWRDVDVLRLG
jgi:hypothetical protein